MTPTATHRNENMEFYAAAVQTVTVLVLLVVSAGSFYQVISEFARVATSAITVSAPFDSLEP